MAESPLRLRHWGYLPSLRAGKLKRAARLLEMELAERPGQLYYEVELGRAWRLLGDPRGPDLLRRLLDGVLAAADVPRSPSATVAPLLEDAFRYDDLAGERLGAALEVVWRWYPDSPPVLAAAAQRCFQLADFREALRLFERLNGLARSGSYDRTIPFSARLLGDEPMLLLAVCHHRLADFPAAERAYRALLQRYPGHPSALRNLDVLQEQRRQFPIPPGPRKGRAKKAAGRRR